MTEHLKKRIADAFLALIRQKNMDKISVKDLADYCHISRQSFYYHYRDILEVIEWILHQRLEKLLVRNLNCQNQKEAVEIFWDFSQQNRTFIHKLLASKYHDILTPMLIKSLKKYLQEFFRLRLNDSSISYGEINMTLNFCAYGLLGILLEDSYSEKQENKKSAVEQICSVLSKLLSEPSYDK